MVRTFAMSRAARLLRLVQNLRRYRTPQTAEHFSELLGVSVRSIYRDIATLREQGATIDGEAGVGYLLKPGFLLPPLMFSDEEIEAIVLGLRLVEHQGDTLLQSAAVDVTAKLRAVLPATLRSTVDEVGLITGPPPVLPESRVDIAGIRAAIRSSRKVLIEYDDASQRATARTIWPLALTFFERVRVVIAHCELRGDYRNFRVDRMRSWTTLSERIPKPRIVLLTEWRKLECSAHLVPLLTNS
jgi:predicted DNA-binding transcriptional regulator YafY